MGEDIDEHRRNEKENALLYIFAVVPLISLKERVTLEVMRIYNGYSYLFKKDMKRANIMFFAHGTRLRLIRKGSQS